MINRYLQYDVNTGEVLAVLIWDDGVIGLAVGAGLDVIESPAGEPRTHYVSAGVVMPRPPMGLTPGKLKITPDGIDESIIGNVPAGCSIEILDESSRSITELEGDGTPLIITSAVPTTFIVTFKLFPYLDETVVIDAT